MQSAKCYTLTFIRLNLYHHCVALALSNFIVWIIAMFKLLSIAQELAVQFSLYHAICAEFLWCLFIVYLEDMCESAMLTNTSVVLN